MPNITPDRDAVFITPDSLHALMASGAEVAVLAVQSVSPYTGKSSDTGTRIPGAIDVDAFADFAGSRTATSGDRPLPDIAALQAAARRWGLTPDAEIVVYDNDRSLTAARAWWVLRWAGLERVRILDGGLGAWEAAGHAVATKPGTRSPSDIRLTPGHMPTLDADAAAAMPEHGLLLDARIRPNYIGAPVGAGEVPRGHIPGALSTPAPDNVTDYGTLAEAPVLEAMYRAHGVGDGRPVGVYCGAGMSAALTVAVLASLGVPAAMYVGSWSAWVTDRARPATVGAPPRDPAS